MVSALSSQIQGSTLLEPLRIVKGQFVHETASEPISRIKVDMYAKDFFGKYLLQSTETNEKGEFSFTFPLPKSLFLRDKIKLVLQMVDYPWEWKDRLFSWERDRVVHKLKVESPVTQVELDLGQISVDFWEYQKELPRLRMPEDGDMQPQHATLAYKLERLRSGWHGGFIAKVIMPLIKDITTVEEVQNLFGDNLTIKQEAVYPGSTRSGQWMGSRILNGFNPCHLRKGSQEGEYLVIYNWDDYELSSQHDLPNAIMKLQLEENGDLVAKEVTLQYRRKIPGVDVLPSIQSGGELEIARTYRAGDSFFEEALYQFRTAYLVAGELDMHLAAGHLNVEQYAVAAFRNFRKSPLRELLFPHLREVVLINHEGNQIIFGKTGILATSSAMTSEGIIKRFQENLGRLDWKGWQPRLPISKKHSFAEVANLYWNILNNYVEEFFTAHDSDIRLYWSEALQFSRNLVDHSVPYHPLEQEDLTIWADSREIIDPQSPRIAVDGIIKAITPIITRDSPHEEDMANLKQACAYAIFHATFWHSWVNDRQKDDGGEIAYGSLGLRLGESVSPIDAAKQLFLAHQLVDSKFGLLLKNDTQDIPVELRDKVSNAKKLFENYCYQVEDLRSLINI